MQQYVDVSANLVLREMHEENSLCIVDLFLLIPVSSLILLQQRCTGSANVWVEVSPYLRAADLVEQICYSILYGDNIII
jgi:hypothetical protein